MSDEIKLTKADLGLTEATTISTPKGPTLVQYVEETRFGQPWCSKEDAEEMLVKTAQSLMRGQNGLKATKYKISFDAAKSEMTLVLG